MTPRVSLVGRVFAAALIALTVLGARLVAPPHLAVAQELVGLALEPTFATVEAGGTLEFRAFRCPTDADGRPLRGADGIAGTEDDDCEPLEAQLSTASSPGRWMASITRRSSGSGSA